MPEYEVFMRYAPSSSFTHREVVEAARVDISQNCLVFYDEEERLIAAYNSGHWVAVELHGRHRVSSAILERA